MNDPNFLNRVIASGAVPGFVTLTWQEDQGTETNAVGLADIEAARAMQPDTLFAVASMTKPITAALALVLMEEGRFQLSDPIVKWAPEFSQMRVLRQRGSSLEDTYPAPRQIVFEDLLTQCAGFSYGLLAPGPLGLALQAKLGLGIDSDFTPDAWMAALAELPLICAPGERFSYGHAFDVLGLVLARVAGADLRTLMREKLFAPLSMEDSDYWVEPSKRGRLAASYSSTRPRSFSRADPPAFTAPCAQAYASGGQGLVSTAHDLLKFARMLMGEGVLEGRRILKPETVRMMTTDRIAPHQCAPDAIILGLDWRTQSYGLGVGVITDGPGYIAKGMGAASTGAFGWPGAFGGDWRIDPARRLIWIWLQEVLPGAPEPGGFPYLPGRRELIEFQKITYAALDS
jgi:CubicO group peptidase (beta-lactamase class C family)